MGGGRTIGEHTAKEIQQQHEGMETGESAGAETGDEGSGMGSTIRGGGTVLGSKAVSSGLSSSGEDTGGGTYQNGYTGHEEDGGRSVDTSHTTKTENTMKRSYASDEVGSSVQEEQSEDGIGSEKDTGKASVVADLTHKFSNIAATSQQKAPPAIDPHTEKPALVENDKSDRSDVDAAAPLG